MAMMRMDFALVLLVLLSGRSLGADVSKHEVKERTQGAFVRIMERIEEVYTEIAGISAKLKQLENHVENGCGRNITFQVMQNTPDLPVSTGSVVKMDTVTANQGNSYDLDTGIFTAPSAGRYMFYANIMHSGFGTAVFQLIKNKVAVNNGHTGVSLTYSTATITCMIEMNKGDQVWIAYWKAIKDTINVRGYTYSDFGGFKYL